MLKLGLQTQTKTNNSSEDFRIEQKSFDVSESIRLKGHSSPELDMYRLIVEDSTPAVRIMASGFQSTLYPTDSNPGNHNGEVNL